MSLFAGKKQNIDAELNSVADEVFGERLEFSKYFMNVSAIYRIAEFLLLGLFLVYVLVSAVNNVDNIRYENLEYIVRNFAFELDENESNTTPIRYNPDGTLHFALYGKGLAVCGKSEINIFSATGRKTCSGSHDYSEPMLVASSKYVYTFDLGGSEYAVYNNFSKVHSASTEYPIWGIQASDNGNYALITRTDDYSAAVLLYDSNFNLLGRYLKNGYVTSVDLNDSRILICTLTVDEKGEFRSELMLCEIGEDKSFAQVNSTGSFPIRCWMFDDGFGVIMEDKVAMFTEKGFPIDEFAYKKDEFLSYDVSEKGCTLVFCRNSMKREYEAVVLNELCRKRSNAGLANKPISVEMLGENVYLLVDNEIIKIDKDGKIFSKKNEIGNGLALIAYSDNKVYFCAQTCAEIITFKTN